MNETLFDLIDIFKQEYTFSNRVSTTTGKVATIGFVVFFFYLSAAAIVSVMSRENKNIFIQNTYDSYFKTDSNYYRNLHVVIDVSLYKTDNTQVEDLEKILKQYLNMQISYITSTCFDYQTVSLYDSKVYINNNMVTYFTYYEIKTTNDFFKISIEKQPLITDAELEKFFNEHSVKIHFDYYFLKSTNNMIVQFQDLSDLLRSENKVFAEFGYFDYIMETKGQDYAVLNKNNYMTSSNNILYYLSPYILNIDTGVLLVDKSTFSGFNLRSKIKNEFASSISSFEFRLTPKIEKYFFSYKKIASSFGEIAGIMKFCRFLMYVYVILITFIKRNQFFSDQLFHREVIVKNYDSKDSNFFKNLLSYAERKSIKENNIEIKDELSHASPNNVLKGFITTNKEATNNFIKASIEERGVSKSTYKNLSFKKSSGIYFNKLVFMKSQYVTYKLNEALHLEEVKKRPLHDNIEDLNLHCDRITDIKRVFSQIESKYRKKNYSCLNFISKTFCSWCYNEKHSRLKRTILYQFYKMNLNKMDIIKVQKKLTLVDILAYLLLEPRHIALLNYVKKEQIIFDYATGQSEFENIYKKEYTSDDIIDILTKNTEAISTNDPRDRKLLDIIEPELKRVLVK